MLNTEWAVPPTTSTYEKSYTNPVVAIASRGTTGISWANPYPVQPETGDASE